MLLIMKDNLAVLDEMMVKKQASHGIFAMFDNFNCLSCYSRWWPLSAVLQLPGRGEEWPGTGGLGQALLHNG